MAISIVGMAIVATLPCTTDGANINKFHNSQDIQTKFVQLTNTSYTYGVHKKKNVTNLYRNFSYWRPHSYHAVELPSNPVNMKRKCN